MLKRAFFIIIFLFLFLLLTPLTYSQQYAKIEKINNFDTDITVNKDGTINVIEKIEYDFGQEYRHGIFRKINLFKKNQDGKKYLLDFNVESVSNSEGNSYKFTTNEDRSKGFYIIKIGDPDRTITSVNKYIISYKVSGAITYFSDRDELYWNITGNEWSVPILKSSSIIRYPVEINSNEVSAKCFTGSYGSTKSDCTLNLENESINILTVGELSINEGLTAVAGFPKNHIAIIEPKLYTPFWESFLGKLLKLILQALLFIGLFLWYVFYPIYIIYKWFRYGRDPSAVIGKVRAWFDAPKTKEGRPLTPSETGSLIDERVDLKDISSAIVDLARRGFLKIEERKKKDFYFIKRIDYKNNKNLLVFEKELLDGIFSEKEVVRLKDKNLYSTIVKVKENIYVQLVKDKFFPKNPEKIRNFYILIAVLGLMTINIPLAIISGIFGRIMPRKTLEGVNASNIAISLKNFLTSQDRQLEYQAKNQMFFEKLLPYAVAFGVEKIWASRFKDLDMKQPDWYFGQSTTFNSTIFVYGLNNSFKNVSSSATSTTSSSGFSSGFSSGGSSGGGGGGGGGGSW